jgi:hypothetical protein
MRNQSGREDFIHPLLNEEIRTIGGAFMLIREERLAYNGREVLYYLGCAVADASCCGPGGFSYARVPGYIERWKYRSTPDHRPVTRVEPIGREDIQKALRRLIMEKDPVQQVNFE